MIANGIAAPDFQLAATNYGTDFKLSDMRGKRVIIAFYPADWSPVCTDQLSLFNEASDIFSDRNAVVVGISVDSKWCHMAFSKDRKLDFSLLADFEPKGAVSLAYGAYNKSKGESERALYLIDEKGVVAWSHLSPVDINPGVDIVLRALDETLTSK